MKKENKKKYTAVAITILILAAPLGMSWIAICGVIKLITMCFGWNFSWAVATGIWLIIMILKSIFRVTVKKD